MIDNIAVCEITDVYLFAAARNLVDYNRIQCLIYRASPSSPDDNRNHRHFYLNTFVLTRNFFNPEYEDDAYGLRWEPLVRSVFVAFMDHHKLDRVVVLTCKNHSLSVL